MKRPLGALLAAVALVACSSGDAATRSPAVDSSPAGEVVTSAATAEPEPIEATVPGEASADTRSITVGGMGSEYGVPTSAVVDIGVSARRPSVVEASEAVSAAGAALVAALQDAGVPASGIQTSNFSISPYFDPMTQFQSVVGYEVSIGYNVVVPDVDSVGTVLGEAIQAGGDSVQHVRRALRDRDRRTDGGGAAGGMDGREGSGRGHG